MKSSLRGFSKYITGAAFVTLALLVPNCQPSGGDYGAGNGGSGGSGDGGSRGSGSGGSTAKGGSGGNSSGGSGGNGSGGHVGTGGSQGSGGTSTTPKGTGGSGAGGVSTTPKGSGGSGSGSGGAQGTGGSQGTGGTTATTTVVTGTGGATTTTTSTSTSTSTGNTGNTVVFGAGKGQGAMTGYGYVALGALDALTDPTCGTAKVAITKATPCAADTQWSATDKLCITGSVPALGTPPDYTGNWGVSVGLNATDPAGGGLGQSFTSVTIAASGSPTSGLRAIVHLKGASEDSQYCFALTPGTAIPLTSFSTTCYDTAAPGTKITATDVPNIDKIAVQVTSGSAAITVASLCITGITFAK